jgi:L-alanine-DL-glutamate epimerase-like enolase superfamily enzyme
MMFAMKFDSIQVFPLHFSTPERCTDAAVIRITASHGLTGYAPCPAGVSTQDAIAGVIEPFLTGRALSDPDALRVQFEESLSEQGAIARDLWNVYGSVEIALWDLASQNLGVPLSEVIGGRVRDRIALYARGGLCRNPAEYGKQAAAIAALGFRACAMPLAGGPEADLQALRLMREAAAINLMIDARAWSSYSFETVIRLAEHMTEFDPLWIEEPFAPRDLPDYLTFKEKDLISLAAGFNQTDEDALLELLYSGAIDYLQMDVASQGGFATARRLLGAASRQGVRFIPTTSATDLDVLIAAHLGICWEETVIEWLEYPFPAAPRLLKEPLRIERGELLVPRGPGLGMEVNSAAMDIWSVPR